MDQMETFELKKISMTKINRCIQQRSEHSRKWKIGQ